MTEVETVGSNPLKRGWEWMAVEPHQRIGVRILQVAIGLMLLFRVLTECPFYLYLWGPHGIGTGNPSGFLGTSLGGVFDRLFNRALAPSLFCSHWHFPQHCWWSDVGHDSPRCLLSSPS
jgi:hypothetical protein